MVDPIKAALMPMWTYRSSKAVSQSSYEFLHSKNKLRHIMNHLCDFDSLGNILKQKLKQKNCITVHSRQRNIRNLICKCANFRFDFFNVNESSDYRTSETKCYDYTANR